MHKITGQKAAEKHCYTFEAVSGVGVVIVLGDEKVKKIVSFERFCLWGWCYSCCSVRIGQKDGAFI